ncbi:MAG TPA: hypothetical protein VGG33_23825 [Polyangia bacterium]
MRAPNRRSPLTWNLSPLGHPLWWSALVLLILNDNLFKGGGVVPGWLTGKLSDFAFLIVAPGLLAALLPEVLPRRRGLAVVTVFAIYAAAELSAAFSDGLVAALEVVGVHWRLWPDVTDLVALAVWPLTHAVVKTRAAAVSRRHWRHPIGVAVGAWACLATSVPEYVQRAFLVNRTGATVTLTVSWARDAQPCDGDLVALAQRLPAESFLPAVSLTLTAGDVAALDLPPPEGQSPIGRCTNTPAGSSPPTANPLTANTACTIARIALTGEAPLVMRAARVWTTEPGSGCDDNAEDSRCAPRLDPFIEPGDGALAVTTESGRARLVAHRGIELVPQP